MSINIGIIGAGKIVENSHLPVLKNIKEAEIKWIFDLDSNKTISLARAYKTEAVKREQLKDFIDKVDICLIALPVGARKDYIELCAEKKAAVYVEKPFARSLKEHYDYMSLFEPYKICIGYQRRFYKNVQDIKSIFNSGLFGRLKKIEYVQGFYDLKSGGVNNFKTDFQSKAGGVILESGIHGLDQILYITNANDIDLIDYKSIRMKGIDFDNIFKSVISADKHKIDVECKITRLESFGHYFKYFFENAIITQFDKPDSLINIQAENINFHLNENISKGSYAKDIDEAFYLIWNCFIENIKIKETVHFSASNSLLTSKWIELLNNYA